MEKKTNNIIIITKAMPASIDSWLNIQQIRLKEYWEGMGA